MLVLRGLDEGQVHGMRVEKEGLALSNSVHTARPPQPYNVYDDENEVSIAANGEHIQIVCCLILQHCRCV